MEALSHRLQVASAQEVLHKRMVIEGVMSIQSGDNPRIVEHKLSVFLEPSMRPGSGAAPEVPLASMPDADDELVKQVRRLSAERRAALSEAPSLELDEILSMSDHDIQVVLRAMDQRDLVVGLKGAPAQVREKFLSNMSVRVRNFIQQEIGDCDGDADKIAETQIRMAQQLDYRAKQKKIELPESDA